MPRVVFDRTGASVEAPEGGRVRELCEQEPRAGLRFGCKMARCGLCLVEVREGLEACAPAASVERALLAKLGAGYGKRLACQLELVPWEGQVRLRGL